MVLASIGLQRIFFSGVLSWVLALPGVLQGFKQFGCVVAQPSENAALGVLPLSVVVHGRRGANSNINGVYIRDFSWHGQVGPCYRRGGSAGKPPIFLYFEGDGEWRVGPSPSEGRVWAYASSVSSSPLSIAMPWQVWDGRKVSSDPHLKVSDTSVIPSVLFLSFDVSVESIPRDLRGSDGMLVQQPGLWDARPYYRHTSLQNVFLLCSVAAGHWRLGPLPVLLAGGRAPARRSFLFVQIASALPQDIEGRWYAAVQENDTDSEPVLVGEGAVRLSTTSSVENIYPRHIVVEGFGSMDNIANGVYRRANHSLNMRPAFQKVDALRPAALWFSGAEWRVGPAVDGTRVWSYSSSSAPTPIGLQWNRVDGVEDADAHVIDANVSIPTSVTLAGERYVQQPRLCDARPVYEREATHGSARGSSGVFLFFRAHEVEWWLGPEVGGTVSYAKASGALSQVIPRPESLSWRRPSSNVAVSLAHAEEGSKQNAENDVSGSQFEAWRWWTSILAGLVLAVFAKRHLPHFITPDIQTSIAESGQCHNAKPIRNPSVWCVVCMEAPRETLLLPCRHVCCCQACADRLEQCPLCRSRKTAFAKVFL